MGLADLHIHSVHSYDGTATVPAILKYVADKTKLNVIAITDHDTMDGVQEALELAPQYCIEVVPGCEVSTADGHLLTLFVDHAVKPERSLVDTVLQVRELGGLCIAAHPTARGTSSLTFEKIEAALRVPGVADALAGIETYNGGLVYTRHNADIAARCGTFPLSQMGNSDAHVLSTIGQGCTRFNGRTAVDLYIALRNHITRPVEGRGLTGLGVLTSYIPEYLLRRLGWSRWNAAPDAPMKFARLSQVLPAGRVSA